MPDGFYGADDGATSPELQLATLDSDIKHLVGQCRAYLLALRGYLDTIGSLQDERAVEVIEALGLTLDLEAPPGSLRYVEKTASELLMTLTRLMETVRAT